MKLSYKYKLYPTFAQERKLITILDRCRELYNAALQERRDAWKKQGISNNYYDQQRQLKIIRKESEIYQTIYYDVLANVLKQLDIAFKGFFRRTQAGDKPGYPRFKNSHQYNTFTHPHGDRI